MTKEQIKDEFIKEFAPCGFIEKDEEQVVPIIIDWWFSKIDSLLQSQKYDLVEKINGEKKMAGLYITGKGGGDYINYRREDNDEKREVYNQAIEDVISLIKQDK